MRADDYSANNSPNRASVLPINRVPPPFSSSSIEAVADTVILFLIAIDIVRSSVYTYCNKWYCYRNYSKNPSAF